jgi:hypothetical protein
MKRIVVVAATVVAVSLIVAAVASARVETTIEFRDSSGAPGDRLLFGTVDSPQGKCRSGRTVKVFVRRLPGKGGGPLELLDTDRTSRHGAWAVRGNLFGVPSAEIRVANKRLGHGKGRCAAATLPIKFA